MSQETKDNSEGIKALRAIRVLRPLKLVSGIPSTSSFELFLYFQGRQSWGGGMLGPSPPPHTFFGLGEGDKHLIILPIFWQTFI